MTLICYTPKKFSAPSREIIDNANMIWEKYEADGQPPLTLRQLYYQFVARGMIENSNKSYKRIGSIISDARLSGDISWDAIEDRERECVSPYLQPREADALYQVERFFAPDLWNDQDAYVEVWVEKKALVGVIESPANKYSVPFLACKGYLSTTEVWNSGQRFLDAMDRGKDCYLIHLGDHDPSGMDMTNDNQKRLDIFGAEVEVRRIALSMDQIQQYKPPSNPTKITDSRAASYIAEFGHTSWELDALEPHVIADLIEKEILSIVDIDMLISAQDQRYKDRARLRWIGDNSQEVLDFADDHIVGGY